VDDVKPKIFKWMLEFLYSGLLTTEGSSHASSHYENLLKLLTLADKYGLKELEEACVERLCNGIDRGHVAETLLLAHKIGNYQLLYEAKLAFKGFCDYYTANGREMDLLRTNTDLLVELLLEFTSNSEVSYS